MDINSVEFYTIAFVAAMALIALLMGHTEKKPPSTYIIQLETTPAKEEGKDLLCLQPVDGGRVMLTRSGITLAQEETVNLIITMRDEQCTIIEKKGKKHRGAHGEDVEGVALLKCFKPDRKYHVRYESQLTSAWTSFSFDTSSPLMKQVELKY